MKLLTISVLALLLPAAARAQQPVVPPDSAQAATEPAAPTAPPAPTVPPVLACQVLTGRITDAFAHPLTGATVMLRTPDKGFRTDPSSTNAEGQYLLTSPQPIPRNSVLEFTAAGYSSVELPLANCQPLDITLEPLPGTRFKASGRIKKTRASGKIR
ncbi:carboxypeptidase-like regulatory domain-containing protein [Hymenobacter sp.]|uniref:carboxypeptidase-like regulatory domain-containing protein n=1 Tax=Hymenobacter sp. TaxID=1898978 RepID=UPI00286A592A|nr:carboxypeptidase-like regulatory domain-containing protein [Hymenobacter sp.]